MRPFVLPLLVMLAVPIAAADPSAEVFLLEGDGGCRGSSSWYQDNESWSYSSTQACSDDFDYARVDADAVSVAASAHHDNASSDQGSFWGGDTFRSDQHSHQSSDDWDRTATAQVGDDRVQASRGCTSDWRSGGSSWQYSDDQSSTSDRQNAYSNDHRCEHAAANASAAGRDEHVAVYDACSSRDSWWSRSSSSASSRQEQGYGSMSSRCEIGAHASGLGAGWTSGCNGSSSSSYGSWTPGDNTTTDDSYSYWSSDSRCENGLFARGPDDAAVFAGERDSSWSSCDDGECYFSQWRAAGAEIAWEHNPLAPGAWGPWIGLP